MRGLLYSGSRDGFHKNDFVRMCGGRSGTLTIVSSQRMPRRAEVGMRLDAGRRWSLSGDSPSFLYVCMCVCVCAMNPDTGPDQGERAAATRPALMRVHCVHVSPCVRVAHFAVAAVTALLCPLLR